MINKLSKLIPLLLLVIVLSSWGYKGHETISYKCVESFPETMIGFQVWADSLSIHGSDADNRKSNNTEEGPKHYIDIDNYSEFLSQGRIASTYDSIVKIHGSSFVVSNGTLPWATINTYDSLKKAFEQHNWHKAMLHAADLGHYVADGHMPLHVTANYNGQLSNQSGIHSRYESTMVSYYLSSLSAYSGIKAVKISDVNSYIFSYIYHNYQYVDSVLHADNYANGIAGNTNSSQYYAALWSKTTFTITLFKNASHALAELIYTAWLEAGSPVFGTLNDVKSVSENNPLLYPNPTSGRIFIVGETVERVEIWSDEGKAVALFTSNELDITHLQKGIYLLKVYSKLGWLKTEKILLI